MDSIKSLNANANENDNKQRASGFPDKSEKKVSFSDNNLPSGLSVNAGQPSPVL